MYRYRLTEMFRTEELPEVRATYEADGRIDVIARRVCMEIDDAIRADEIAYAVGEEG